MTTREFVRANNRTDASLFSLVEQKGLIARLGEELARAAGEFSRDPQAFIRNLFSAEKDMKRRRRMQIGLAGAFMVHIGLIVLIAFAGWHYVTKAKEKAEEVEITWVNPYEDLNSGTPRGGDGNKGGGGNNGTRAPSKGVLPQSSPAPQVVKFNAPSIRNSLPPIPPTVVGYQSTPPPPDAQLGIPTGEADAPPAPEPGTGGGIGGGQGTGAGPGKGPGAGPGSGGGPGNSREGGSPFGDGSLLTAIPYNKPIKPEGFIPFAWIYRSTPVVTPEAQANKVVGTVLLRATFRAEGTITDIEVINPVQFMTESAVDALKRSRFRPATVNGVPITLLRVPVRINVHY